MVVEPSLATAIGWNTTVKVPSLFWVTDWYGRDGAKPADGSQSAGAPLTWLLTSSSGQIPLGSTSVMVIAELSVYSPESTCSVYVEIVPATNSAGDTDL